MVSPGMRRYAKRTEIQATLVGPMGSDPILPEALFGRSRPLRLEIGAGHGEFVSQLAAAHPDTDIIANEFEHIRVTKIAHKCVKAGLDNTRVFAGPAESLLPRLPTAAFERIYILFPDPWPKQVHRRRRLVNHAVLRQLTRVAAPGCRFVFASDTHNYACQVLSNLTLIPGCWRNVLTPTGYRFDIPTRFPTVFERHKKAEGCTIMYVIHERTAGRSP